MTASWGHIVVAVDHPHDAALVLYPDGSTADFRGYDMPKESEPRNWWRFRQGSHGLQILPTASVYWSYLFYTDTVLP